MAWRVFWVPRDAVLSLYGQSNGFRRYTAETMRNYATDIALLLSFLWARGRVWTETVPRDLEDYEHWRRFAEGNPQRIGGSKWDRELAAFASLFACSAKNGYVRRNPVAMRQMVGRNGEMMTAARVRGRPTGTRTRTFCNTGMNCGLSAVCPAVRTSDNGRHLRSAAR